MRSGDQPPLSKTDQVLIDRLCDEFERAFRDGSNPAIEHFVDKIRCDLRQPALHELVAVEIELRRTGGEQLQANSYRTRFPDLDLANLDANAAGDGARAPAESNCRTPAAGQETPTSESSRTGSGRLEVRCPSCHTPMEVAVDTGLTDLTCSSCGSHFSLVDQSKATHMAPAISKLGRFELIERLGVGGFGSVWKARDKELDRTVAIKVPRAGGMTPEEQEKFFREARATAQLRHPSIVSVHEVGRDGDSVYIVSDFVRGVTLDDWLTGQQLTCREAVELCAKIADALHHAHEQGVVHRDLKPANIMMGYDGQPHLMDFGLARRESGEITMTIDGQVLGTPAYMSPEQAAGEAHTADRRSDVYSLGVILFQLLTGELPFRGNVRMLIKQVIEDEPPSPRKLNSHIPIDLETITLKCLEKNSSRRYQSIAALAADLRCFLAGQPVSARAIGPFERAWRWFARSGSTIAIAAGTFAIFNGLVQFFHMAVWGILVLLGAVNLSPRTLGEVIALGLIVCPMIVMVGFKTVKGHFVSTLIGTLICVCFSILTYFQLVGINLGPWQLKVLTPNVNPIFDFDFTLIACIWVNVGLVLYIAALYARLRTDSNSSGNRPHAKKRDIRG